MNATREEYIRRYGLLVPKKPQSWCAHILAGAKRCPLNRYPSDCPRPPHLDHPELFLRDGKLILTSQPYLGTAIQGADLEALETQLETWASSFGLSCRISPEESWHFPGHTILYEVWQP
jgi:hypothetical protein